MTSLERKRTHTLIDAWWELNLSRWPKKALGTQPVTMDSAAKWRLMQNIERILGQRVVLRKIATPKP